MLFFFALQISIIGAKIGNMNPIVISAFQMFSGGLLTLLLNITYENFSIVTTKLTGVQIMAVGFLIIFNTLIAYLVQTTAPKYIESTTISLILSTEILFGAITSVILLGDIMTIKTVLGGLLIFASVVISETELKFLTKNREC